MNSTTWNFQLRATYWFGMTMCDTESAPNHTKTCTPDSDKNDLEGTNPRAANYIGKHPGNAYMELQFYEPGWVPQFEGFACGATQYCAAMTIDSFSSNQNTGVDNDAACNQYILGGIEPVNWAYVTTSGKSQAPANPVASGTFDDPNFAGLNPDPSQDLMMNPGDTIRMHMHDTPAGCHAHPRNRQHVRGKFHHGVRAVAADGVPHISRWSTGHRAPVRQLQQRRLAQPLSCLPVWSTTLTQPQGRRSGAAPYGDRFVRLRCSSSAALRSLN